MALRVRDVTSPVVSPDTCHERRLNRAEAAAYVSEKYGVPLRRRTLEATPLPYIVVNRQALYERPELDRYAQSKIAAASRRTGRAPARETAARLGA